MIDKMINDDSEIVTIIVGADANQTEAKAIADAVGKQYPDLEFEIHQGGSTGLSLFRLQLSRLKQLSRTGVPHAGTFCEIYIKACDWRH